MTNVMQGDAGLEVSSTLSSTYVVFKGKMSTINDEKLIEEVCQHPVLNNNTLTKYKSISSPFQL